MLTYILSAFALMLVMEGIMPLLCPRIWRQTLTKLSSLSDNAIHAIGLTSMLAGLAIVTIMHYLDFFNL